MVRFDWKSPAMFTALAFVAGAETSNAGVWDFWKTPAKKSATNEARRLVARGQEPNPAPPDLTPAAPDPGYDLPAAPAQQPVAPAPAQVWMPPPVTDCAPHYSGFSHGATEPDYYMGHAYPAERKRNRFGYGLAKSSARMHGDSYYEDCFPLFGPRYGYYETCWRRLPEDCRCPVYVPARKSQTTPVPDESQPSGEVIPPPPQVLNFR